MLYFAFGTLLGILAIGVSLSRYVKEDSTLGFTLFFLGWMLTLICGTVTLILLSLGWLVVLIVGICVVVDGITKIKENPAPLIAFLGICTVCAAFWFATWLLYVVTGVKFEDILEPMIRRATGS